MDPNAAVERLKRALADGDIEEANEAYADLEAWEADGGFPPVESQWRTYRMGVIPPN